MSEIIEKTEKLIFWYCNFAIFLVIVLCSISIFPTICLSLESDFYPTPHAFIRPSSQLLFQTIYNSPSVMSKSSQEKAASLIKDIDSEHMKYLSLTKLNVCAPKQFKSWVKSRSLKCHALTPLAEQTLIASLALQIEILDCVLDNKNKQHANELRKKRSMIRIRKKTESFFGDSRDIFICRALTLLEQIDDLQSTLGATGETRWDFPAHANSFAMVEDYLLGKMTYILNNSYRINLN